MAFHNRSFTSPVENITNYLTIKLNWNVIFILFNFTGSAAVIRYSIYSGDPEGYFNIDPVTGNIRIASALDHETKPQVLLYVQATSGNPPDYGRTQVNVAPPKKPITYEFH